MGCLDVLHVIENGDDVDVVRVRVEVVGEEGTLGGAQRIDDRQAAGTP